jgi:hypothetical protein
LAFINSTFANYLYKYGLLEEIQRQKNFRLSHILMPEKQHLETPPFGGAIQEAGAVKNNKIKKVLPVTLWKLNAREDFGFYFSFSIQL